MILRIALLFLLVNVIAIFQSPWFDIHWIGVIEGVFNFHAIVVLFGGAVLLRHQRAGTDRRRAVALSQEADGTARRYTRATELNQPGTNSRASEFRAASGYCGQVCLRPGPWLDLVDLPDQRLQVFAP